MVTFRISTEVRDDHRVELVLPAEVPTGKADLVVSVVSQPLTVAKRPRSSLADWADQQAEHWSKQLDSTDVGTFTGRRF